MRVLEVLQKLPLMKQERANQKVIELGQGNGTDGAINRHTIHDAERGMAGRRFCNNTPS